MVKCVRVINPSSIKKASTGIKTYIGYNSTCIIRLKPVQKALSTPACDEQVSPKSTVPKTQSVAPEQAPSRLQYIPKYNGAAEMETRRCGRMVARQARRGPGGAVARASGSAPAPLDFSS
jgi:hypothetical protein